MVRNHIFRVFLFVSVVKNHLFISLGKDFACTTQSKNGPETPHLHSVASTPGVVLASSFKGKQDG